MCEVHPSILSHLASPLLSTTLKSLTMTHVLNSKVALGHHLAVVVELVGMLLPLLVGDGALRTALFPLAHAVVQEEAEGAEDDGADTDGDADLGALAWAEVRVWMSR